VDPRWLNLSSVKVVTKKVHQGKNCILFLVCRNFLNKKMVDLILKIVSNIYFYYFQPDFVNKTYSLRKLRPKSVLLYYRPCCIGLR